MLHFILTQVFSLFHITALTIDPVGADRLPVACIWSPAHRMLQATRLETWWLHARII